MPLSLCVYLYCSQDKTELVYSALITSQTPRSNPRPRLKKGSGSPCMKVARRSAYRMPATQSQSGGAIQEKGLHFLFVAVAPLDCLCLLMEDPLDNALGTGLGA